MARKPKGSITHGTGGYNNYGCRCLVCKAAYMAYRATYRQRRRAEPGRAIKHGTVSGYNLDGCRCRPCKAARGR